MIVSFRHQGLEELFKRGKSQQIDSHHRERLLDQMAFLNRMTDEKEILGQLSWGPQRLSGKNPKNHDIGALWSLKVSGNWRLTYYFDENAKVVLADYMDYH